MKKYLGQNFLVNSYVIDSIISHMCIETNDFIFEIGPGKGALTDSIVSKTACCYSLTVLEKDKELIPFLKKKFFKPNIKVLCGDILKFDLNSYLNNWLLSGKVRILGNLPYYISSQILFKLLESRDLIQDQLLMLQKEVADRIIATPKKKEYGKLSVLIQLFYEVEKVIDVTPDKFKPIPKVHSSVIKMSPTDKYVNLVHDKNCLFEIVRRAFSMKRKMIKNCLVNLVSEQELQSVGIAPTERAQHLPISKFISLSNLVSERKLS